MTQSVEVACRCGQVLGKVSDVSPTRVNRVVCYCDDCQAYLHHLGRADLLDEHGGSDVVQVAPAALHFERGAERIAGLRLAPKGLFRWYAACCNTPLGNTLTPGVPFVGIVVQAFKCEAGPEAVFGKPIGASMGKFAIGTPPQGANKWHLRLILRILSTILGWRVRGKSWPNPFFQTKSNQPSHPVVVLSPAERDALRPLCGPRPNPLPRDL